MLGRSRYDIKRSSYGSLIVRENVDVCDIVLRCIGDGGFQCIVDGGGFRIVDLHVWSQGLGALEDVM